MAPLLMGPEAGKCFLSSLYIFFLLEAEAQSTINDPPQPRYPNESLSRTQALKGMTLDAAYASFAENELGSLSPGKKADFVIFDKDIMTIPIYQILEAKVKATVIDGQAVYGAF
jgi:predicted amidohydrolase YtcJ